MSRRSLGRRGALKAPREGRGHPPPGRPTAAARFASPKTVDLAVLLACVALALWTHRRVLAAFFGLDDLVILEEVRGLRLATPALWRLVSRTLFFGATVPLFGSNAFPYVLVGWLVHGANVALLYRFVRGRSDSTLAALVGAVLFGSSRLHVTALSSPARIGEPLALGLTLAALLLHDRGRVARMLAPVLFGAAVLSKESVVLLPAVLLLPLRSPHPGPWRERLARAAPLLAVGAALAVALAATGAASTSLGGEAYARAYGWNLISNLMTYARWVVDLSDPFVGQVSAIANGAWPVGLAATLGLVAVCVVVRRAALPPAFGALWWLLALLPVLPLLHHTYLYYLYVPLAGVAMSLAGVVEWAEEMASPSAGRTVRAVDAGHPRSRSSARPSASVWVVRLVAVVLVLVHAATAERMIAGRIAARMPGTAIALDPDERKSEMARHATEAVAGTLAGRAGRVGFLAPPSLSQVFSTATGELVDADSGSAHSYRMLEGALDGGRGLRALLPNVDSVVFLPGWRPGHGDFELFAEDPTGKIFALGRGADGFATAAQIVMDNGERQLGREWVEGALTEFPDHAPLRYQHARSLYLSGDSLGMRRELEELIRRAPQHPLAARARAGLASMSAPR